MKNGERILIAFIPQAQTVKNINKTRKIAGIKVKRTSGLKTPHITIIDNSYSNLDEVNKILESLAKETKPIRVRIKGIDTFIVKKQLKIQKYSENNSLIYLIKDNPQMNNFRKQLYKKLDFLKSGERLEQWKNENPNMPKRALENVNKYGTPFGLKGWKFHATVGLIQKDRQKEILEKIKSLDLSNDWIIGNFGLFIRKSGWVLFKKYQFMG